MVNRRWIPGLAFLLLACEPAPAQPWTFVRPVVRPEHPLALSNPRDEPVLWPLWGGAFAIDELAIRASLAATGEAGLVIAGPGPIEDRVAVELVYASGPWMLRETLGGEPIGEVVGELATDGEVVIELSPSTVRVIATDGELALDLTNPLGPVGAEAGLYVSLDASAELIIDELSSSAALPSRPELEPPLRELSTAHGIDIGTAFDIWPPLHDLELESLLAEQFGRLAPTEFYWSTTRGEDPRSGGSEAPAQRREGQMDQSFFFVPADLAVNYATVHGQAITGMFLIWDYALPSWLSELDPPALEAAFDEHISTIVDRYEGRVDTWIVVNEAIWGPVETGDGAEYAQTLWYDALGPDYIERAFAVAHAADPNATLLYNETGAEALDDKSDFMVAMLAELLDRGAPIDGVGLQFHVHAASPPAMASVQANMERLAALGLSVHITELDVSLDGIDLPEAEALELQAQIYVDVLETCLAVPACETWTVFGFGDRYAWDELGDATPLLFDADWAAKPAFFAVRDALR